MFYFSTRGLVFDIQKGNFLKLAIDGKIVRYDTILNLSIWK